MEDHYLPTYSMERERARARTSYGKCCYERWKDCSSLLGSEGVRVSFLPLFCCLISAAIVRVRRGENSGDLHSFFRMLAVKAWTEAVRYLVMCPVLRLRLRFSGS